MIERVNITEDYSISRIIKGGWQLAGGHGNVDSQAAISDMLHFYNKGVTTFDCADIYTGVEELIGSFIRQLTEQRGKAAMHTIQVHTKYVPDLNMLPTLKEANIKKVIQRSIKRLGVESLSLVQFHWWDFGVLGYVETALILAKLRKEGLIQHIGVTNFDTKHLAEIVASGVDVRTNQVQYSVLDRRPEKTLVQYCKENGISLLTYGSLAGGFLSERYLNFAEPLSSELEVNRSLIKYKLIIDDLGGWEYYQNVLSCMKEVGKKHSVTISEIAVSYMLQKKQVAGVIVGARNIEHINSIETALKIKLTREDVEALDTLSKYRFLKGDVYELERYATRHKRIMKYNLNKLTYDKGLDI